MKRLKQRTLISTLVTIILGTLLHFTYELSGNSKIVGAFSAVNESVWEHLKLLFFPMLVFAIVEFIRWGRGEQNFICAKTIGIISGLLTIVVVFYSYSGIIGKSFVFADIAIFFLAAVVANLVFYLITVNSKTNIKICCIVCFAIIILLLFSFIYFTFKTPEIAIFNVPVSGGYWMA